MRRLLLWAVFLFPVIAGAQCMSGAYTVGGVSPNYTTVTAAVNALTTNGVCGPVVLNLRNGTFNEQFTIGIIAGVSAVNNITIQSENLDSTLVTIQFTPTLTNSFVICMNQANYVTLNKLTIKSLTFSYPVINFFSNSDNITIKSCVLNMTTHTTLNTARALIYSSYSNLDNILIMDNIMLGGNYGVSLASSAAGNTNIQVLDNTFNNQYHGSIYSIRTTGLRIEDNTFTSISAYASFQTMNLGTSPNNFQILRNTIVTPMGGIYVGSHPALVGFAYIQNNSVVVTGGSANGINVTSCYGVKVMHNTVQTNGGTGASVYFNGGGSHHVVNNIFSNVAGGYSYVLSNGISLISDGNLLYSSGPALAYGQSQPCSDIDHWRLVTGRDTNSVSISPLFVGSTNLHVAAEFTMNMPTYSTAYTGVNTDLDSVARTAINPYPGAYEFTRAYNVDDASVFHVRLMGIGLCAGTNNVSFTIRNYGTAPLTSVTVNWDVNGVLQTPVSWTGNLAYDDTALIVSPGFTAPASMMDSLRVWTSSPNGGPDPFSHNDSNRIDGIPVGLIGTYTVGGASPDFATFTAARNALVAQGICGPVIFNVRNGTYNEQVDLPAISGSSSINTITFRSQSNDSSLVNLIFPPTAGNNYIFRLNGAQYVTIEAITMESSVYGIGNIVVLTGGAHNATIRRCRINGVGGGSVTTTSGIYSPNTTDSATHIENNRFLIGSAGIYLAGNATELGIVITGNEIIWTTSYGIFVSGQQGVTITDNNLNCYGAAIAATSVTTKGLIANNKITGGNYTHGIFLTSCTGLLPGRFLVVNNTVSIQTGPGAAGGIILASCNGVEIYHNSVNLKSANAPATTYALSVTGNLPIQIRNNIFSSTSDAIAVNFGAVPVASQVLDNNDYYTSGSSFGKINTTVYSTFAQWKTASNRDASSLNLNPYFYSVNDLHCSQVGVIGMGTTLAGISPDIDGQVRPITPCMGADEFSQVTDDAGAAILSTVYPLCAGVSPVTVILTNYGTNNLTSAVLNWRVNISTQAPVNWTGSLLPGDSVSVVLGLYNFPAQASNTIRSWTTLPNSVPDNLHYNDTVTIVKTMGLNGVYTVGGASPSYATVIAAATALQAQGVCGPVVFNIRNGTYAGQFTLDSVAGVSAINTVRFTSESGDSSLVNITSNSNASNNFVVKLVRSSYITFDRVTLQATNVVYATVIQFAGRCSNDTIKRCRVYGPAVSSPTPTANMILANDSAIKKNIVISGNYIYRGDTAIYWRQPAGSDTNITITNNLFNAQWGSGIALTGHSLAGISKNTFNSTGNTGYCAIILNRVYGSSNVNYNNIQGIQGKGIIVQNSGNAVGPQLRIYNNFISCSRDGISLAASVNVGTYFNSLNITSSFTGIRVYSGGLLSFSNNAIATSSAGALWFDSLQFVVTCNRNSLYSTSGLRIGSTTYPALASWQGATTFDINSVWGTPAYTSPTDLHATLFSPMSNLGSTVPGITDDIDYGGRSGSPDIGADEFSFAPNDAGSAATMSPLNLCNQTTSVNITLENFGTAVLTSVNVVIELDGVAQSPVAWTGSLAPNLTTAVVVTTTLNVPFGTHSVRTWTELPNGIPDGDFSNDTSSSILVRSRMSGTFTVGGSTPDFNTLTDVATALDSFGICGPVVFNIRPGTYSENIVIRPVWGASSANSILFQPENGDSTSVFLQDSTGYNAYTLTLPIIWLKGADYVQFSHISFRTIAPGNIMLMMNDTADRNLISHCAFWGMGSMGVGVYMRDIQNFTSGAGRQNKVLHNGFYYGGTSIDLVDFDSTEIRGNLIHEPSVYGMTVNNPDEVKITDNYIISHIMNCRGINIASADDTVLVIGNKVELYHGNMGIYVVGQSFPFVCWANVSNNIVRMTTGANPLNGLMVVTDISKVHYNTIVVNGTVSGNTFESGGGSCDLRNNIFVNETPSGSIAFIGNSTSYPFADYNDYYGTSSMFVNYGNAVANLSALQVATGREANSVSVDPMFSPQQPDYPSSQLIDGGATPIALVATDYYGTVRDLVQPDMGAVETVVYNLDAAVTNINSGLLTCTGTHTVIITLSNYGTGTLNSASIGWSVNGIVQTPLSWSGTILPTDSVTGINVGAFTSGSGTAQVMVWSYAPNASADGNAINDTIANNNLSGPMSGVYTVAGVTPDYVTLSAAIVDLQLRGVCGPVEIKVRQGVYNEHLNFGIIPGVSAQDSVWIHAETNDSTDVVFITYIMDRVVDMYQTRHVTLEHLTFDIGVNHSLPSLSLLTIPMNVFLQNSDSITIRKCRFLGTDSLQPSNNYQLLQINNPRGILIEQNYFGCSSSPITVYGGGNEPDQLRITRNYVQGTGLRMFDMHNFEIDHNNMPNFYLAGTREYFSITHNIFRGSCMIIDHVGLAANRSVIFNNFFRDGLVLNQVSLTDVVFNNFNKTSSGYTLSMGLSAVNFSANNVVSQSVSPSQALLDLVSNPGTIMDRNNYWQNGPQNTLLTTQHFSGWDINSITVDPLYASVTDLHVSATALVDNGITYPTISDDIDGDVRNGLLDIGADEIGASTVVSAGFTSASTVCVLSSIQFANTSTGAVSYQWLVNGNPVATTTNLTYTFTVTGSQTVTLIAVNGVLSDTLSQIVNVVALPVVSTSGGGNLCEGDSLLLTASGGTGYSWLSTDSLSAPTSASTYAFPVVSTTYTVTVTDNNGCSDTGQVSININALPSINVTGGGTICAGDSLLLTASGGVTYLWTISDSLSAPSSASTYAFPSASTTYTVTVTNSNGCTNTAPVSITVNPLPTQPIISQNGDTLFCSAASAYQWNFNGIPVPGATGPYYLPPQNGNYSVTVTDVNGCSSTSATYAFIGTLISTHGTGSFVLYPVPVTASELTIQCNSLEAGRYVLSCMDVSGQLITEIQIDHSGGFFRADLILPQTQGIYFIKMTGSDGMLFIKPFERL